MLDRIRDVSWSSLLDCTSLGAGGPVRLCAEEGHVVAGHLRGRTCPRPQPRHGRTRSGPPPRSQRRPGDPVPPADSRTTAETTQAATPTLTLADDPQQLHEQAPARRHGGLSRPLRAGLPRTLRPESGLRAVDPMDIWLQAVSGPLGRTRTVVPWLRGVPAGSCPGYRSEACSSGCTGVRRRRGRSGAMDHAGAPRRNRSPSVRRPRGADPGSRSPSAHPAPGRRSGRRSSTTAQVGHQVTTELPRAETAASRTKKSSTSGHSTSSTSGSAKRSTRKRILGWTLLGAGAVILLGSAWVGWRTYQAYDHLQAASQNVTELQDELRDITDIGPHGHRRNRRRPAGRGGLGQVGSR